MSRQDATTAKGEIEACLDEIKEFVETLGRYTPTTIAIGLSVNLQSLLRALLECDLCTQMQVREFIQELEREVFEESES